jgi:hypothetical protein
VKTQRVKLMVLVALAVVLSLPGVALADYAYVQTWYENGLYGAPATNRTWNIAEAVIETAGATWTGTGLSGLSAPGWSAALESPTIAVATGPTYNVATSGNFYFTTTATSPTDIPVTVDWLLWNGPTFVGGSVITLSSTGSWFVSELSQSPVGPPDPPGAVPLPPSLMLLGSALVGLVLLRRKPANPS